MHQRHRGYTIKDLLNLFRESDAKARLFCFVEIKRLIEFLLGFISQYNGQLHLANARALISSHGVAAFGRAMLKPPHRRPRFL